MISVGRRPIRAGDVDAIVARACEDIKPSSLAPALPESKTSPCGNQHSEQPAGFMSQLRKHVGHLFQVGRRVAVRAFRAVLGMLTDLVGEGIASELGGVFADFLLDAANRKPVTDSESRYTPTRS